MTWSILVISETKKYAYYVLCYSDGIDINNDCIEIWTIKKTSPSYHKQRSISTVKGIRSTLQKILAFTQPWTIKCYDKFYNKNEPRPYWRIWVSAEKVQRMCNRKSMEFYKYVSRRDPITYQEIIDACFVPGGIIDSHIKRMYNITNNGGKRIATFKTAVDDDDDCVDVNGADDDSVGVDDCVDVDDVDDCVDVDVDDDDDCYYVDVNGAKTG